MHLYVAISVSVNVVIVAVNATFQFELLHKLQRVLSTLRSNGGNIELSTKVNFNELREVILTGRPSGGV